MGSHLIFVVYIAVPVRCCPFANDWCSNYLAVMQVLQLVLKKKRKKISSLHRNSELHWPGPKLSIWEMWTRGKRRRNIQKSAVNGEVLIWAICDDLHTGIIACMHYLKHTHIHTHRKKNCCKTILLTKYNTLSKFNHISLHCVLSHCATHTHTHTPEPEIHKIVHWFWGPVHYEICWSPWFL